MHYRVFLFIVSGGGIKMSLFKKRIDEYLYAPAKGQLVKLEDVKDTMFSKKLLGNGVACMPEDNVICSPCDGRITMIATTSHAFGVTTANGAEILIHIGFDTVNLNGEGLHILVDVNQRVKAGTPVLKLDLPFMKEKNIDLTTPVILTNGDNFTMEILQEEGTAGLATKMIKILKK